MNKPYNDLGSYLQNRFGTKVYKIALPGGITCPTRDGSKSTGGCIFCSEGGSGDFAAPSCLSIKDQISYGIDLLSGKLGSALATAKYIAYFQSYTCTYVTDEMLRNKGYQWTDSGSRNSAEVQYLRDIFLPAILDPRICAISLGTRPDCLSDSIVSLISELNSIKPVFVELGLQTSHEKSAVFINRGYSLDIFEDTVSRLRAANIEIIVHLILGLPFETKDMMLSTVSYISNLDIQGVKLQLLHVIDQTPLGRMFKATPDFIQNMHLQSVDEYVDTLISALRYLRKDIVIHRLTGDAPHDKLLFPLWSANKRTTLNKLHHDMSVHNVHQGDKL